MFPANPQNPDPRSAAQRYLPGVPLLPRTSPSPPRREAKTGPSPERYGNRRELRSQHPAVKDTRRASGRGRPETEERPRKDLLLPALPSNAEIWLPNWNTPATHTQWPATEREHNKPLVLLRLEQQLAAGFARCHSEGAREDAFHPGRLEVVRQCFAQLAGEMRTYGPLMNTIQREIELGFQHYRGEAARLDLEVSTAAADAQWEVRWAEREALVAEEWEVMERETELLRGEIAGALGELEGAQAEGSRLQEEVQMGQRELELARAEIEELRRENAALEEKALLNNEYATRFPALQGETEALREAYGVLQSRLAQAVSYERLEAVCEELREVKASNASILMATKMDRTQVEHISLLAAALQDEGMDCVDGMRHLAAGVESAAAATPSLLERRPSMGQGSPRLSRQASKLAALQRIHSSSASMRRRATCPDGMPFHQEGPPGEPSGLLVSIARGVGAVARFRECEGLLEGAADGPGELAQRLGTPEGVQEVAEEFMLFPAQAELAGQAVRELGETVAATLLLYHGHMEAIRELLSSPERLLQLARMDDPLRALLAPPKARRGERASMPTPLQALHETEHEQ